MTARSRGHIPLDGDEAHLKTGSLRGARIGVLRQLSNTPTADAEVLSRFEQALLAMRTSGAIVVDPTDIAAATNTSVGLEMLGAEWSEMRLLKLAYAYETATHLRRAPTHTPPLARRVRR
jgi:Asp-tRNA(Asn)/Glu-tRNA(Gln) amidotransferase A subunit family amidase